jgi:hypothetical protein
MSQQLVQLGFGVLSDVVIQGLRVRQTVQEELSLTSHGRHCHRCPMPDIICIACVSTQRCPLQSTLALSRHHLDSDSVLCVCVVCVCVCVCVGRLCHKLCGCAQSILTRGTSLSAAPQDEAAKPKPHSSRADSHRWHPVPAAAGPTEGPPPALVAVLVNCSWMTSSTGCSRGRRCRVPGTPNRTCLAPMTASYNPGRSRRTNGTSRPISPPSQSPPLRSNLHSNYQ